MTVDAFLERHPDFELVPVKAELSEITSDGIVFDGALHRELNLCRRFYPHVSRGEGQFVALLKRSEKFSQTQRILYKDSAKPLSKDETRTVEAFFSEALTERPAGRLVKHGDNIVLIEHGCPLLPKSVFMYGTLVGEIQKGNFKPSHHFFSVFGHLFRIRIDLSKDDTRLYAYLRGEEIKNDSDERGWCAVLYLGATIGGGKISGGVVKNHYPKGLRN